MSRNASGARFVAAVFCLLILAPFQAGAEEDCGATFDVSIGNEEETDTHRDFDFNVEIGITSDCAVVLFELIIETQSADGETKTSRKPGRIKLHDQNEMTQVLTFSMPIEDQLTSYEAQLVSCSGC